MQQSTNVCSLDESIWNNVGECYTVVLKHRYSLIIIISPICFNLTAGKMTTAIAHHRNSLEIQEKVEILS